MRHQRERVVVGALCGGGEPAAPRVSTRLGAALLGVAHFQSVCFDETDLKGANLTVDFVGIRREPARLAVDGRRATGQCELASGGLRETEGDEHVIDRAQRHGPVGQQPVGAR